MKNFICLGNSIASSNTTQQTPLSTSSTSSNNPLSTDTNSLDLLRHRAALQAMQQGLSTANNGNNNFLLQQKSNLPVQTQPINQHLQNTSSQNHVLQQQQQTQQTQFQNINQQNQHLHAPQQPLQKAEPATQRAEKTQDIVHQQNPQKSTNVNFFFFIKI